jgi:S1-C subfamily serine protease
VRRLLLLPVLLLGLAVSKPVFAAPTYAAQTVRISSRASPGKWSWRGSGVLVSQGVLTALHVVEGKTDIRVILGDGRAHKVASWKRIGAGDAALIKLVTPVKGISPLPIISEDLKAPANATCLGYWGKAFDLGEPAVTQGKIFPNAKGNAYHGSLPLEFGMSGGPVIVNGTVVGVVQGKDKESNFYTKVSLARLPRN